MTKTIIFALTAITSLMIFGATNVYAPDHDDGTISQDQPKAIPGWVDNNFKWYGEGKIAQSDLLNSLTYMLDNGYMHLSDKTAQEMHELREENKKLRMMSGDSATHSPEWTNLNDSDPGMTKGSQIAPSQVKVLIAASAHDSTSDQYCEVTASHSYTDENGKEFLMVPSPTTGGSDDKSSCWVRVSQTHAGDPDQPVITGRVYNTDSDDRPTEEVAFYYNRISFAQDTVDDIIAKGGSTSAWEDGIDKISSKYGHQTTDSVVDELQGVVVLCSNAIEKEIQKIETELKILEELHDKKSGETIERSGSSAQYGESDLEFIKRHAERVDGKILTLQAGLKVLQEKLATADSFSFGVEREMKESGEKGGTEDINIGVGELQEDIDEQQQKLQTLSNESKNLQKIQVSSISIG